jgi:transcriptional regulator with XRE-family HTH domain
LSTIENKTASHDNISYDKMYSIVNTDFNSWLNKELSDRGWSQSDLSKAAGLSRGTISNVLNNVRNPGNVVLEAIAKAFRYPPEIVYRAAGILPPTSEHGELVERILAHLDTIPDDQLEIIEVQMAALTAKLQSRKRPKTQPLRPRNDNP